VNGIYNAICGARATDLSQHVAHTSLTMKQTRPMFSGITLLLLGLLITTSNYFVLHNPLNGIIGIFSAVVGVTIVLLDPIRKD
jgi:hypothetical protein